MRKFRTTLRETSPKLTRPASYRKGHADRPLGLFKTGGKSTARNTETPEDEPTQGRSSPNTRASHAEMRTL